MRTGAIFAALLLELVGVQGLAAYNDQAPVVELDERGVDQEILAAVQAEGKSGRLEYHGDCPAQGSGDIRVHLVLASSAAAGKPLPISQLFASKNKVAVNESHLGIVVVATQGLWRDLMKAKVTHVQFNLYEQYDPFMAIIAVVNSPSMATAMERIKASPIARPLDRAGPPHVPRDPHIDASLDNVTVEQALDSIQNVFHGLVVYKECAESDGSHRFIIYFYP